MEKDNQILRDYLNSLPIVQHQEAISKIAEECSVKRSYVYLWKGGKREIRPIYKKVINRILGIELFSE